MNASLLLAQCQPSGLAAVLGSLALPVTIFLIFYVIWFMPLRRKQKELEQVIEALEKGDKVITNGGIMGEVVKADGPIVLLKIADNVRIRIRRTAIAGLEGSPEQRGS